MRRLRRHLLQRRAGRAEAPPAHHPRPGQRLQVHQDPLQRVRQAHRAGLQGRHLLGLPHQDPHQEAAGGGCSQGQGAPSRTGGQARRRGSRQGAGRGGQGRRNSSRRDRSGPCCRRNRPDRRAHRKYCKRVTLGRFEKELTPGRNDAILSVTTRLWSEVLVTKA